MRLAIYLTDLKIDDVGTTLEEFMRGLVIALKRFSYDNSPQAGRVKSPYFVSLPDEPFLLKFFRSLNMSCLGSKDIDSNISFSELYLLHQVQDKRIIKALDLILYLFTSEVATSIPAKKAIDLFKLLFVDRVLIKTLDIEELLCTMRDSNESIKSYKRFGFKCSAGQGLVPDRAYLCLNSLENSVASSSSMCISATTQPDGVLSGTIHQIVLPDDPVIAGDLMISPFAFNSLIGRFFPKMSEVKF